MTAMHKTPTLSCVGGQVDKKTHALHQQYSRELTLCNVLAIKAQIHDYMLILKPIQTVIGVRFSPII